VPTASSARSAVASPLAMWSSFPNVVLPRDYPNDPCTRDANRSKQRMPAIEPGLDGLHQNQVCQGKQRDRAQQRQRQWGKPEQCAKGRVRQHGAGHGDGGNPDQQPPASLTYSNCWARCRFCTLRQWNSPSGSAPVGPQSPCSSTRRFGPALAVHASRRRKTMLWTICVILLVLWALGMATAYTAGGLIHLLLVIALVVLVFRVIQGRRILG